LLYGNRDSGSIIFLEELAQLKDRYLDRFNLVHVLSREPQDIELLHGRIDRAKADALFERWIPVEDIDYAFICGPEGMMDAVRESLAAHGLPADRIRIERFAASIPKHTHVPRPLPQAARTQCEVSVVIDGSQRTFLLEKGQENIIDAGLRNGIELPYSC
jgi:ring-1,2-phenylacetyl-CoA epoxidase subunit PaaE